MQSKPARGAEIKKGGYGSIAKRRSATQAKTNGATFAIKERTSIPVEHIDLELTGKDLAKIIDATGLKLDEFAALMKFGSKAYYSTLTSTKHKNKSGAEKVRAKPLSIEIKVRLSRMGLFALLDEK